MLESSIIAFLISILLGFLAGLGVGGGSLLILLLTLVLNRDHQEARILNLMFFLPTALISSLFQWKQKNLDLKALWPGILAGAGTALVFSILSQNLDMTLLRKLFGALLLLTGIREIVYRPSK